MDDKVQAARVQGKYGLKIAVITGIFGLLAAVIALVPSLVSAKKENAQLKEDNASLIAASLDYVENAGENNAYQQTIERTSLGQQENVHYQQTDEKSNQEQSDNQIAYEWQDFISLFDPYEAKHFSEEAIIKIMGEEYHQGIKLCLDYQGLAYYNLGGKYVALEFDFGHIDGSALIDAKIDIYVDGVLIKQLEGTSDMVITHYTIPLNNAKQLRFEWNHHDYAPEYGMVNVKIR